MNQVPNFDSQPVISKIKTQILVNLSKLMFGKSIKTGEKIFQAIIIISLLCITQQKDKHNIQEVRLDSK